MKVDVPSPAELVHLIEQRDPASVSITLPSSPLPSDHQRVQLSLRNAARRALDDLESAGVASADRRKIADAMDALQVDREFWASQARSLAVFASTQGLWAYRTANRLPELVAVGDRFDAGPLLRAVSLPAGAFVLSITRRSVRLFELGPEQRATEVPLPGLPSDVFEVLEREPHDGQADYPRAQGATGPKVEQRRFCSLVQDAVLPVLGDAHLPLILNAADDFDPAYREVNTYRELTEASIRQHPESLTEAEIDAHARAILDEVNASALAEWRDRFADLRGAGRAVSQLTEVARAATAGAIEELWFDLDATALEGTIDAAGSISPATAPSPTTYGLLDEIAARVLRTDGTVKAVRKSDLPDDTPVAAILRYAPVASPGESEPRPAEA